MSLVKSCSGVLIGLYATVLGCGTDATQLPSDASRPVEQTPDAQLMPDAQLIDGSPVPAMPDASPPECLDTPLMIFGGSIEGEEFDHEVVEFADGRIFVLRRLLDGSSAPAWRELSCGVSMPMALMPSFSPRSLVALGR